MLPEIKTSNGFIQTATTNNKMCETAATHETSPMLGNATQIVITEADNTQTLLLAQAETGNDSCCSSWFVSRDKNTGSRRRRRNNAFHQVHASLVRRSRSVMIYNER
jgi:hypothetical protein